MKYTAAVHYQFMRDKGEALKNVVNYNNVAFLVSNLFDPSMKFEEIEGLEGSGGEIFERLHLKDNYYPEEVKPKFRAFKDLEIPVFVEGYRHCCERCYLEGRDPYHEYVCANGHALDFDEQKKITKLGIDTILENTGIKSIGSCAPNHQSNRDTHLVEKQLGLTYSVRRNGFNYIPFVGDLISLPAWEENGLIILPESKIPGKAPLFYVMYSEIEKDGFEKYRPIFEKSVPLSELEIREKPQIMANLSEWLVYRYKKFRDFKKRFG